MVARLFLRAISDVVARFQRGLLDLRGAKADVRVSLSLSLSRAREGFRS